MDSTEVSIKRRGRSCEAFYKEAKDIANKSNFIIDISDTLHGYPDVYYDLIHCTTKGNKLIAERIYDELNHYGVLKTIH
jgi:hypothetical protein